MANTTTHIQTGDRVLITNAPRHQGATGELERITPTADGELPYLVRLDDGTHAWADEITPATETEPADTTPRHGDTIEILAAPGVEPGTIGRLLDTDDLEPEPYLIAAENNLLVWATSIRLVHRA